MNAWGIDGKPGSAWCWDKHPTYSCPLSELAHEYLTDEDDERERERGDIEDAAYTLGADPERLAKWLRYVHSNHRGPLRLRDDPDGKLTELCAVCGHRLKRVGFRCWHEVELREDRDDLTTGENISFRLNGRAFRTVRSRYVKTKREAEDWARHNARKENAK